MVVFSSNTNQLPEQKPADSSVAIRVQSENEEISSSVPLELAPSEDKWTLARLRSAVRCAEGGGVSVPDIIADSSAFQVQPERAHSLGNTFHTWLTGVELYLGDLHGIAPDILPKYCGRSAGIHWRIGKAQVRKHPRGTTLRGQWASWWAV